MLFDDEIRHPPEYYLITSASLDVGTFRQRRYSSKTQGRIEWVKEHYNRYIYSIDRRCCHAPLIGYCI